MTSDHPTMHRHRVILLVLSITVVAGSISTSLGYATYLRSDRYRHSIESEVSEYLQMPTTIGQVQPLSGTSRQFARIKTWLPGHRSQVFECVRAIWRTSRVDGNDRNTLEIRDGWFLLGTGEFSADDYDLMLRSGLGQDFRKLNLAAIRLDNMDVLWRQADFELQIAGANGEVLFDADGNGRATLMAHRLNGTPVSAPIDIAADFTPGPDLRFHTVVLHVPRIPLSSLGLDHVLGGAITVGWFDGSVTYHDDNDGGRRFTMRGSLADADLNELTRNVPGGPFEGRGDVRLDEATFGPQGLITLRFNGRLADLRLSDVAPMFDDASQDSSSLAGRVTLRIHQAHIHNGRLIHLSAAGEAADVPMAAVTRLAGRGMITGTLVVKINSLIVVDDRIRWADIDLEVVPPDDAPGTIDRQVLLQGAKTLFDFDLGQMAGALPEKVEYARIGCRLVLDQEWLSVYGSHGTDGRSILTIRVFGQELGVIKQPNRMFPMTDLIAAARERLTGHDIESLLRWWEAKQPADDS